MIMREKSRRLSLLPDLESLIVFMKRLLSESQRFCVFSVNFREILGNGQASASPKSDLYQMRTLAESLAEYAGIDGTGCVIGPWELLLIPDAPLERSEKMVVVPKIREFFQNPASLHAFGIEDGASLRGDIRVGVLEAALNCKLSLDYQVLRIFQDLNTTLNDGGKGADKGYDTSYKIEACIQEIIQRGLISTRFQPIYSLKTAELFGYECLSFPTTSVPFLSIIRLIEAAKETSQLTLLEGAMRERAFFNASRQKIQKRLAVNIDPEVVLAPSREIGLTKALAQRYGLSYDQLVVEVTENVRLPSLQGVLEAIAHYKRQGFVVAIDDVGAGISLIPILVHQTPDIIKIDRGVIQDLGKSYIKLRLVRSLVDLAHALGVLVVAEGIETFDELKEVYKLGVDLGQGYFLGRPNESVAGFSESFTNIHKLFSKVEVGKRPASGSVIEELKYFVEPIFPNTKVRLVVQRFKEKEDLVALPVVNPTGSPVGLVVREPLFLKLSSEFGYALYCEKPIERLMDPNPVIVEATDSLERVSRACLERPPFRVYDPFLVTTSGKYSGLGTVHELFRKTSELQILFATYANPLTGLPGNIPIYDEINRRIQGRLGHVVVYADLDNFKAYNDRYGFTHGDDVIKYTAFTLKSAIDQAEDGFLGHVGGDDFIFILPLENSAKACMEVVERFDASIANFYTEEDRSRGYIVSQDREGHVREFPLIAISLAGVLLEPGVFRGHLEVGEEAAKLKKVAKKNPASCFVASWKAEAL